METKDILRRYADHYDAIKRMGSFPLSKQVQLSDLGDLKEMKAETQRSYNDMKKDNLNISVIDYLCLISTLVLVNNASKTCKNPKEYIKYLIDNYATQKEEMNNLLRLFNKKPEYLFSLIKTNNIELYKELAGFWFNLYIT